MKFLLAALAVTSVVADHCKDNARCAQPKETSAAMRVSMRLKELAEEECLLLGTCPVNTPSTTAAAPCVDGFAGIYPCNNVDLLSFVNHAQLGCRRGNDIWGWVDPSNQREYAIMGCTTGTSFVDVTDPVNPTVLGFMPRSQGGSSTWSDIKVYKDFAFIVSEERNHGMQVYDLRRLRGLGPWDGSTPTVPDSLYEEHGSSHNMVINEETGFGYSVGSNTCRGGLHVIDLRNTTETKSAAYSGCFDGDGYTHDAECVVYRGPDSDYYGREICFAYNEDTLTIVDVEDKRNMKMISRVGYDGSAYSHQGWLNAAQTHLLLDDELDETEGKTPAGPQSRNTRTLIWDVSDLDNPKYTNDYYSPEESIDHNLYILGDRAYQANYESGLRILDTSRVEEGELSEVGFFGVRTQTPTANFNGAWSNYPYFPSGNIVVSGIESGLFTVKFNDPVA